MHFNRSMYKLKGTKHWGSTRTLVVLEFIITLCQNSGLFLCKKVKSNFCLPGLVILVCLAWCSGVHMFSPCADSQPVIESLHLSSAHVCDSVGVELFALCPASVVWNI